MYASPPQHLYTDKVAEALTTVLSDVWLLFALAALTVDRVLPYPPTAAAAAADIETVLGQVAMKLRAASYELGGKDLELLFARFDTDRNGVLGRAEFASAVRKRVKLSEAEVDAVFARYDADGSGTIDVREFLALAGLTAGHSATKELPGGDPAEGVAALAQAPAESVQPAQAAARAAAAASRAAVGSRLTARGLSPGAIRLFWLGVGHDAQGLEGGEGDEGAEEVERVARLPREQQQLVVERLRRVALFRDAVLTQGRFELLASKLGRRCYDDGQSCGRTPSSPHGRTPSSLLLFAWSRALEPLARRRTRSVALCPPSFSPPLPRCSSSFPPSPPRDRPCGCQASTSSRRPSSAPPSTSWTRAACTSASTASRSRS